TNSRYTRSGGATFAAPHRSFLAPAGCPCRDAFYSTGEDAAKLRNTALALLNIERMVAVLTLDGLARQGSLELSRRDSHIAFRTMAGANRHPINETISVAFGRRQRQQDV